MRMSLAFKKERAAKQKKKVQEWPSTLRFFLVLSLPSSPLPLSSFQLHVCVLGVQCEECKESLPVLKMVPNIRVFFGGGGKKVKIWTESSENRASIICREPAPSFCKNINVGRCPCQEVDF